MQDTYDKLKQYCMKSTNYAAGQTVNDELAQIHDNIPQALSVRSAIMRQKIIKNQHKINARMANIAREYRSKDIAKLSQKYDYPPLSLLRSILIHSGQNESKLYNVFSGKTKPETVLSGRDLAQYHAAGLIDAESNFDQQTIMKIALDNEALFVDYFKGLGIKLKTEQDLITEQTKELGAAHLTPDILFVDDVVINGARVHWIDFKNYAGTPVNFLYASNAAQAHKYAAHWGPGAICYRWSYVEDLALPGAILLDGSALPINYIPKVI
jgi:hypothetical protein